MVKKKASVAAALAALAGAAPAMAHVELMPTLVNRYVTVLADPEKLTVIQTLLFGELPGNEERQRMDTDGDGEVSEAERTAATSAWKARAPQLLAVTLDGAPLPLDADALVTLGQNGMVQIDLVGTRPLSAGEHTVRVEPRQEPPRAGETEIVLDALPGAWELASSRRAADPPGTAARVKFDGPRVSAVEDRSVTFVLRPAAAAPAEGRTRPRLVLGIAAAALAMAAAGAWLLRRSARAG